MAIEKCTNILIANAMLAGVDLTVQKSPAERIALTEEFVLKEPAYAKTVLRGNFVSL